VAEAAPPHAPKDNLLLSEDTDLSRAKNESSPTVFFEETSAQSSSQNQNSSQNHGQARSSFRKTSAGGLAGTAVDDVSDDMSRSHLDDYYSHKPRSSFDDEDDEFQQTTGLEGAIPMDKIKNGASNAFAFWQWGVSKVAEQAKEVQSRLNENENFRQASEKMGHLYEERVKPGFETVREGAHSAYEKAKPAMDDFAERAKPTISDLSAKAGEGWNATKERVGQFSEACKPGLDRAAETTREAFERVKASAQGQKDGAAQHKKDDDDSSPPFTQI